ncbi:hypothetical protein ACWEAF_13945 [Streptomyces sp. NPDC005071]
MGVKVCGAAMGAPCTVSAVTVPGTIRGQDHDAMDWISPASGLVGALIGGGASLYGSRLSLMAQLQTKSLDMEAARAEQEDAERGRIVELLGPRLAALMQFLREGGLQAEESSFRTAWLSLVAQAELAALEIRDQQLRELITTALSVLPDWRRSLRYVNRGRYPEHAILGVL